MINIIIFIILIMDIYIYLYLNFFIIFYNLCDLKLILQQFVIFILKIINYFNLI